MDLLGGLKTEIFRPVIMLMVPGLVVEGPAIFVLQHYQSDLFGVIKSQPTLFTFIGFIAAVILGILTYEIGTNIEAHWIDKRLKKERPKFDDEWYMFLRCTLPERTVAQDYLNDRVLYLKFELGMASALPLCLMFSTWAWIIRNDFYTKWFVILLIVIIISTTYFLFEAKQSGAGLARLRNELLKGIGDPPL
ncbi:MAG: hypothetical protein DHS20C09_21760 [marine bacterium B5-7]|nr:MAG: hypothetical protein DHS20C09_21760 [marine bacterium B5-7]